MLRISCVHCASLAAAGQASLSHDTPDPLVVDRSFLHGPVLWSHGDSRRKPPLRVALEWRDCAADRVPDEWSDGDAGNTIAD